MASARLPASAHIFNGLQTLTHRNDEDETAPQPITEQADLNRRRTERYKVPLRVFDVERTKFDQRPSD